VINDTNSSQLNSTLVINDTNSSQLNSTLVINTTSVKDVIPKINSTSVINVTNTSLNSTPASNVNQTMNSTTNNSTNPNSTSITNEQNVNLVNSTLTKNSSNLTLNDSILHSSIYYEIKGKLHILTDVNAEPAHNPLIATTQEKIKELNDKLNPIEKELLKLAANQTELAAKLKKSHRGN